MRAEEELHLPLLGHRRRGRPQALRGERRDCKIWREREAARLREREGEMGVARVWTRAYRGG
jgi:hypothetical protein